MRRVKSSFQHRLQGYRSGRGLSAGRSIYEMRCATENDKQYKERKERMTRVRRKTSLLVG